MAKTRNTTPSKILIDPMFQVPPGSEDNFTTVNPVPVRPTTDKSLTNISGSMAANTGDPLVEPMFLLQPPDAIVVIDQKLRRAPGGQQVVDITIDVEEIIGALEYEVQVAKV